MSICALAAAFDLCNSTQTCAQDKQVNEVPLEFIVASIHPASPGPHSAIRLQLTPDGLRSEGVPVYMVLWQALGVPNNRIFGAPDWTRTAYYDIEAKVDSSEVSRWQSLPQKEKWQVVLLLLDNRFGLKWHHESRAMQSYTHMVGKGGPKMKDTAPTETESKTIQIPPRISRSDKGVELRLNAASIQEFASALTNILGSTVTDATGLAGRYDFILDYSNEPVGAVPMDPKSDSPSEDSWPSIFTALQEKLGLKLESRKEPADVVIIEQIQRPTSN